MKTAFLMLLDTLGSTFRMLLYFGNPSPFAENGIADVLNQNERPSNKSKSHLRKP